MMSLRLSKSNNNDSMMWLVIAMTLTLTLQNAKCDPCDPANHAVLKDTRRRPTYTAGPGEDELCDKYLLTNDNWYRFGYQGAPMATTCPATGTCATYAPIWMDGTNPTIADGEVSRKACQHDHRGCCGDSYNIMAKLCTNAQGDTFYVYQLKLPNGCDAAYCADFGCDQNKVKINGACEDLFPPMTKPVLSGPFYVPAGAATSESMFYFECKITGYPKNGNAASRFEVTFLADDIDVLVVTIDSTSLVAQLYNNELVNNVKSSVRCKARSYWDGNIGNAGPHQESVEEYYIGLKVLTDAGSNVLDFDLATSDQEKEIALQTTVPIVCDTDLFKQGCELKFAVKNTNVGGNVCQLTIKENDWDQNKKLATSSNKFTVAVPAQVGQGVKLAQISFHKITSIRPIPLWQNVVPPPIQVRVVLEGLATCRFTGDPHFATFGYYFTLTDLLGSNYIWAKPEFFGPLKNTLSPYI